jgi:protease secretion system outer membrane protein
VRYQQGGVQAAFSDAVFDRKEAELAVKLSAAYFDALFSMERLALTDAEISAYRRSANWPSGVARVARGR